MKTGFKYLLVLVTIFFFGIYGISAKEVSKDNIDRNTYVIGTHIFSRNTNDVYNGQLTTKLIMLAAKTIDGDSLDDMIIYYKNPKGKWIDGISGEEVVPPSTFEIHYEDTKQVIEAPTLYKEGVGGSEDPETGITKVGASISTNELMTIELSCKYDNGEYEVLGEYLFNRLSTDTNHYLYGEEPSLGLLIMATEGQKVTCRARKVVTVNGEKRYSDYSNEIVVDYSTISVPTLYKEAVGGSEDPETGITTRGATISTNGLMTVELSCKYDNGEYEALGEYLFNRLSTDTNHYLYGDETSLGMSVTAIEGQKVTCRARKVVTVNGEKRYSDYSNEIVVDNSTI